MACSVLVTLDRQVEQMVSFCTVSAALGMQTLILVNFCLPKVWTSCDNRTLKAAAEPNIWASASIAKPISYMRSELQAEELRPANSWQQLDVVYSICVQAACNTLTFPKDYCVHQQHATLTYAWHISCRRGAH